MYPSILDGPVTRYQQPGVDDRGGEHPDPSKVAVVPPGAKNAMQLSDSTGTAVRANHVQPDYRVPAPRHTTAPSKFNPLGLSD